ncbi:hypothetical protein [Saccharothrix obliqua]|uniref:hypothetical protein n=1 Tax=Saccharothrix obliqua TaxID=2861747 RepID=UPI001C604701|nr:hypothetical protein [Saccharothrix obliqua]MBW4717416.1 hypothetical protein [Saccharothrix obliqua]
MMTTTVCIAVSCDTCGDACRDEERGRTVYFGTESEALEWLSRSGWHVTGNGRALSCAQCVAERTCAEHGHVTRHWADCECSQSSGHHQDDDGRCTRQFTWCERCLTLVHRDRPAVPGTREVA